MEKWWTLFRFTKRKWWLWIVTANFGKWSSPLVHSSHHLLSSLNAYKKTDLSSLISIPVRSLDGSTCPTPVFRWLCRCRQRWPPAGWEWCQLFPGWLRSSPLCRYPAPPRWPGTSEQGHAGACLLSVISTSRGHHTCYSKQEIDVSVL